MPAWAAAMMGKVIVDTRNAEKRAAEEQRLKDQVVEAAIGWRASVPGTWMPLRAAVDALAAYRSQP